MQFVGKFQQDPVNDANSAFIFLANLLISQGFQAGGAGMTFGSSGTGMVKSIPEVQEWEGNGKKTHSLNSGTGRE